MRYIFFVMCGLVLVPIQSFAQTASIESAVGIQKTIQGTVLLEYTTPIGSTLSVSVECPVDAKVFFEETGGIASCGDVYEIPNPNPEGAIKIVPYDVPEDTSISYELLQDDKTSIAQTVVATEKTSPVPLFTQVTVRQPDPLKALVRVAWDTLATADMFLTVGCNSEELVLIDEQGNRYSCNEKITLAENADDGSAEFRALGHSSREGLLFTFAAQQEDEIRALKNISFTFETRTEPGVDNANQNVIARLIAQVKALLNVVAGLFS